MRCLTLLALLIVGLLATCARAGKVTINGACVDCHRDGATTHRPSSSRGPPTTPKSKSRPKSNKNSDEDDFDGWMLSQGQGGYGAQSIWRGGRHRRQIYRQQIITDPGLGSGGGWSGGRVTTINTRGRPGTYVHNDDCVGCNING
ncbi:PREDICTED: uncharacterized protein LOC108617539 [Drosophila arizonae]|uniref:Uncharacterized protein LOC108617539 n=1 Tax=Drosophila arizonae TaxID=7263 RepID=A0ABM1PNQ9_DROAR|nr:PREDICTED: uncharacterized protein LOC108617539 [Drosophila arizonae]